MIEQGIYFALGCIVTALLALAFAPFFWRRALRLTRHRLQLQVPLSMREILAERDGLRAEFAVERLRLEQAMQHVRASKTRDMAEIGRQAVAATALADEAAALRRLEQAQEKEIGLLLRDLSAADTENASLKVELHDSHARLDRWKQAGKRAMAERKHVLEQLESHRAATASLETRIADAQRANEAREASLRGRLEAAMAQSARHETSGLTLRRELDEAKTRIRALDHDLRTASEGARALETTIQRRRPDTVDKRRPDRANAETVETPRTGNAAPPAEVASARREPDGAPTRRPSGGDETADDGLRAAIHALGLAVATMTNGAPPAKEHEGDSAAQGRRLRDQVASPLDVG